MTILLIVLLIVVIILAAIYYKFSIYPGMKLKQLKQKYGKQVEIIDNIIPLHRTSYLQDGDSLAFYKKLQKEKPNLPAAIYSIGQNVGFFFLDPELIKQVHQNNDALEKRGISPALTYILKDSLFFSYGKSWQRQRQFLGKSFHFDQIKSNIPDVKYSCSRVFGEIYQKLKGQPQLEVEVVTTCEKVTSEVVQRTFFGQLQEKLTMKLGDGSTVPIVIELLAIMRDATLLAQKSKITLAKNILLQGKSLDFFPTKAEKEISQRLIALKAACNNVIQTRKEQLIQDPSLYKYNFLDLYLKEILINKSKEISDKEIIDNFLGMFFAGTDTTSNMAGAALYFLAMNPSIQKKAREEVSQLLSQKTKSSNPSDLFDSLTFEDISSMNYMHAILKECLRLIPPAPGILFRTANRDIKIGDFLVEKGSLVNTFFYYNQLNSEIFPDPLVFDPNRWLNNQQYSSFTPFSIGQRNCIGQHLAVIEGKIILAYILLHFEVIRNSQELKCLSKTTYGVFPDNLVYFQNRKI